MLPGRDGDVLGAEDGDRGLVGNTHDFVPALRIVDGRRVVGELTDVHFRLERLVQDSLGRDLLGQGREEPEALDVGIIPGVGDDEGRPCVQWIRSGGQYLGVGARRHEDHGRDSGESAYHWKSIPGGGCKGRIGPTVQMRPARLATHDVNQLGFRKMVAMAR